MEKENKNRKDSLDFSDEKIPEIQAYLRAQPKLASADLAIAFMYFYDGFLEIIENLIGSEKLMNLINQEISMQRAISMMALIEQEAARYKENLNEK